MEATNRPYLRTGVALVSAIGLGAGGLLIGFVLVLLSVLVLLLAGFDLTPTMQIVLSLVLVQGIGCAGVALAYLKLRPYVAPAVRNVLGVGGEPPRFRLDASIPDLRDAAVVVGGYALALGAAMAGSLIISLVDVDTGTNQAAEMAMEAPEILLLLIPASFLIIGPGEEALFRGVVQGRLREVFGPVSGVLLPSAIFAGLHWFALSGGTPTGNLLALGILFGPAVVLGASYEYTGNIVVPSLIHGAYNATLFTLLYVSIEFADQIPQGSLTHAVAAV